MSNDDPIDITPFVDEIFTDVVAELQSRLSEPLTDLPEADRVAILTAVMKGAWRGVLTGIAVQTHAVNEASHDVDVQTWAVGVTPSVPMHKWSAALGYCCIACAKRTSRRGELEPLMLRFRRGGSAALAASSSPGLIADR